MFPRMIPVEKQNSFGLGAGFDEYLIETVFLSNQKNSQIIMVKLFHLTSL